MRPTFERSATLSTLIGIALVLAGCAGSTGTSGDTTSVASVALTPATDSIVPQQALTLSGTAKDASGNAISDATISWSVTPASVASVSTTGVLTATAPGTAIVTALSGGKSGTATITVLNGAMVGAAGATLTGPAGVATLVIPAGALASNTPISIASMVMPPAATGLVTSSATDFGPTGTQFAQPVTIHLHYNVSDLPAGTDPSQLQLFLRTGSAWTLVSGSSVDTSAHVITGTTTHFSGYAGCEGDCILSLAKVSFGFVNPYAEIAQGGSYVATDGEVLLPDGSTATVAISFSGLSSGITAAVTSSITSTFSITIHVGASVPVGEHDFQVIATPDAASGVLPDTTTYRVVVVTAAYGITPNPANLSIVEGSVASTTLTLARVAFTNSVALSATNLPTGVTASFNPAATTGNASVLTLTASAGAPVGNYTVTIHGVASGLSDVTTTLPITIQAASGFTLAGTPAFATVAPGGSGSTGVQATRLQSFAGSITYSDSGLPAGLTASFASTTVVDSMAVRFTATASVAPGTYPITITGTSGSKSSSIVISVTVTAPGMTTVHLDYSNCTAAVRPVYLAYQDGSGAYTQVSGAGGVFAFDLTQSTGSVVVVTPTFGGTGFLTSVMFGAAAELSSMASCSAPATPTTETINFALAGMLSGDDAYVSTPLSSAEVSTAVPSGTVNGPSTGTVDATVMRFNSGNPTADVRGLIDRGINLPNGGDIGTLDLNGAQSFAPLVGSLSVMFTNDEPINWSEAYITQPAQSCTGNLLKLPMSPADLTVYGFPSSVQQTNDLHVFTVFTATRETVQYAHAFSSPTVALGPDLSSPSITELAGAYKRPQVSLSLPVGYQFASYSWGIASSSANRLSMLGSTGYFGGSALTLAMPDLSMLPGYNLGSWAPTPGSGSYSLVGISALTSQCTDGAVYRQAFMQGTN